MSETLTTLQNLFTFAFVVSSMLGMGLALTLGQIVQPLRNVRLVLAALVTAATQPEPLSGHTTGASI